MNDKITCEICGGQAHAMAIHIRDNHPEITLEQYQKEYPDAPIMSETAKARIEQKRKEKEAIAGKGGKKKVLSKSEAQPMHKVFGLTSSGATKRPDGSNISIEILPHSEWSLQVPEVDENYVFNVEMLKTTLMGLALNIPTYLWGHAGTGKTTIVEQVAARTNRPLLRVQHTGSTDESHILGQTAASEEGTFFEPGPLPMAMRNGWIYLADEYDFAFPQVLAVYQSVLEGKPLVIKEAPADSGWRLVKPHPNFRIFATGNTNGTGDETGLFSGTNVQNAANYERFGIVEKMPYMDARQEAKIVSKQGGIALDDAQILVKIASKVRDAFDSRKIAATMGPRVLINCAKVGVARASFYKGIQAAFINRLSTKDREIVSQITQRELGEG